MPEPSAPYLDRIRAGLLGAISADPTAADELLRTAAAVAESGGNDLDALRAAGLAGLPEAGPAAIILRGIPCALLTPMDRSRLRRMAGRCAALAKVDEGAVVTTVATAVLAADLARGFDIETALMRCHQTLLEEAPTALLSRLRPFASEEQTGGASDDPTVALQAAITLLSRAEGVDAILAAAAGGSEAGDPPGPTPLATTLAAALAGLRDGWHGFEGSRLETLPQRDRAEAAAAALAAAATPPQETPSAKATPA